VEKSDKIAAASKFLKWIFDPLMKNDKKYYLAIWCNPRKATYWFTDIRAAAVRAVDLSEEGQDVYFGLGLHGNVPAKGRGTAKDVVAITCVWADIDYADSQAHKPAGGKILPANEAEAIELIDSLDIYPSIITHSGHGLQAYWLLKTPIVIADQHQRDKTSDFTRGWLEAIRSHAAKRGQAIDSVADLSRVFRVSGTMNLKAKPVPVRTIYPKNGEKPRRLGREEIKKFIISPISACLTTDTDKTNVQEPKADVEAVIPRENPDIIRRIKLLCEISPKLQKTWDRKRPDLVDTSASSYDLALANALIAAGATDQDVADAILAWRIKHDEDANKAMRRDYLMKTIQKAKTSVGTNKAATILDKAEDEMVAIHDDDEPDDVVRKKTANKQAMIKAIGGVLGIPIERIIQQGRENSTWSIRLMNGIDIYLGDKTEMTKQHKCREAIYEATTINFKPLSPLLWHDLVRRIGFVRELEVNEEATRQGIIVSWLKRFCGSSDLNQDWESQYINGSPFIRKYNRGPNAGQEILCIQGEHLLKFINGKAGVKIRRGDLHDMLRLAGFTNAKMTVRIENKPTCRSIWMAPPEILEEKSDITT